MVGSHIASYTNEGKDSLPPVSISSQDLPRKGIMSSILDWLLAGPVLFRPMQPPIAAVRCWLQCLSLVQKIPFPSPPSCHLALTFSQLPLLWCPMSLEEGIRGSYILSATSSQSLEGRDKRCQRTLWKTSNVLSLLILTNNCFVLAFLKMHMDLKPRSKTEYERKQLKVSGIALGAWVNLNMSYYVDFFSSFRVLFVLSEILYMRTYCLHGRDFLLCSNNISHSLI